VSGISWKFPAAPSKLFTEVAREERILMRLLLRTD
jgi:hypothetical protein